LRCELHTLGCREMMCRVFVTLLVCTSRPPWCTGMNFANAKKSGKSGGKRKREKSGKGGFFLGGVYCESGGNPKSSELHNFGPSTLSLVSESTHTGRTPPRNIPRPPCTISIPQGGGWRPACVAWAWRGAPSCETSRGPSLSPGSFLQGSELLFGDPSPP